MAVHLGLVRELSSRGLRRGARGERRVDQTTTVSALLDELARLAAG